MKSNRHKMRECFGHPVSSVFAAALLCAMLLSGCAESDPYRRLEPGLTRELTTDQLVDAYDNRWPRQFKSVQTVTIDFGPVTKTFNALLIIQRPGRFRLQGMTEQGIKIFDLLHNESGDQVLFKADEMSERTFASISRDIQRVFLASLSGVPESDVCGRFHMLRGNSARFTQSVAMVENDIMIAGTSVRDQDMQWAVVDAVSVENEQGRVFGFRQFEWIDRMGMKSAKPANLLYPTVIVLRDSGRESGSYPYKLTIKITELTVRDTPWPEKTFRP